MAEYKVAQDVEAEDKLLGPFSFRQFIYLIVVVIAGALAWGLAQIFVGLAIIPLPIILFFGALALPLRKDQPMEIYLAAIVSFYLKPRKRLWSPDGVESLIEITAPKTVEPQLTKDLSQTEAERRLSYLADIADTGGWAIRHVAQPEANTSSMTPDQYYAAQQTVDVLDDDGGVAHHFDQMISSADSARRQRMVTQMQQAAGQPPQNTLSQPEASATDQASPQFNPYPTIHQSVINPIGQSPAGHQAATNNPQPTTSAKPVSDDIIGLANNSDLSIETIQREASRIQHKKDDDGEVFISLH